MLEPLGSLDFITDDFILLKNEYNNGHQIFNKDGALTVTRNIQDISAVGINGGRYVSLDSEKVPNYIDYDDKLTETTISGHNVVLDKVRFHFISGFDFNDFKALVLSVKNKENDGTLNTFCNILFSQATMDTLLTFNPKPLYVTNRMYDRYVDVYIPSIKNINEEFNTSPTPATTFSAAITPTDTSYSGFITNEPIIISIDECETQEEIDTDINIQYDAFKVSMHYETTVSQSNEFDGVGVYIDESSNGDFIEFFLTFNGGFPEELISILNKRNPLNDWIIAHELTVYEQLGSTFVQSSRLAFFQDDGFDEPNLYRPVLKNANQAVSMSIDYIARLVNRSNGDQIIREGSYVLISPKKYGLNLLKIQLNDKPQSQKVYNKIYKKNYEATELFIDPSQSFNNSSQISPVNSDAYIKTEYLPIYTNSNKIAISQRNGEIPNFDNIDEVIFGQGKLRFVISPFDNYLKFKLFDFKSGKPVALDLNTTAPRYRAVFETSSGKIKIDNLNDSSKENLSVGEIVFSISNEDSEQIVQSEDKTFYLTAIAQDGTETLMYNGEWRLTSEYADVENAIAEAKESLNEITKIESKITEIEEKVAATYTKKIRDNLSSWKNIKIDIPGLVRKNSRKKVSTVNRFGIKNATKLTSNRSTSTDKGQ
jgi:hypothetical protein